MKKTKAPERKKAMLTPTAVNILSDFLTASFGWLVFNIIRYYSLPVAFIDTLGNWLLYSNVLLGQLLVPAAMVLLYAITGVYSSTRELTVSRLDEMLNTLAVSFVGMLGIFFTTMLNDDIPERLSNYELMAILLASLAIPTGTARFIISTRRNRRDRELSKNTPALLVADAPDSDPSLTRLVKAANSQGYKVVALHNASGDITADRFFGLPVRHGDIESTVRVLGIKAILLPYSAMRADSEDHGRLYLLGLPILVLPDLNAALTLRPKLSSVRPEPLIDITAPAITPATRSFKRLGDVCASALALLCLSPVFAVIALAIKLDSRGPVFYRQERLGIDRKPFMILKFRSMRTDAEAGGPQLSSPEDSRTTRVGHWMRKYRIDELPQFWNVLRGDMSIVGPRPERPYFAEQIAARQPAFMLLHKVRPGITSWGMVKYGYAQNVDQMVERMAYDLLYLQNVSLSIDLKILLHTVATVITGRGV